MSATVEAITRRLRADPYRLDLLIERLLLQVARRQPEAARGDLATVQRLGLARTFGPSLARAVRGELRVLEEGGGYLLYDPALEPALVGWTLHFLRDARCAGERFFGPLDRCVVIELSPHSSGFHRASSEVPGLGYIKLSPRHSLVEHEAVIAHELAHVYLTSGNRFLDEAIAVYFQGHANGGRIFVGTELETAAVLSEARDEIPPLRAMLAYDARNDVYFERIMPNPRRKHLVYAAGYTFAAHLIERLSISGLKALCASLRGCVVSAAHPALVETTLGIGIESLDRMLYREPFRAAPSAIALTCSPLPSATIIWSEMSPDGLQKLIQGLRDALVHDASASATKAALARALIRRVLDREASLCAVDFAEARSLVYDLSIDVSFPDRDRLLLEGWLAIAQTHAAPTTAVRVVSWEKALDTFKRALERFPEDPEVLCGSAVLHLRGPEQYGASRTLARACLDGVRHAQGWSALADAIEKAHGLKSQ